MSRFEQNFGKVGQYAAVKAIERIGGNGRLQKSGKKP
jgi:hypothetical protein